MVFADIMINSIFDTDIAEPFMKQVDGGDPVEVKGIWVRDNPNYMIEEFGGVGIQPTDSFRTLVSAGIYVKTTTPPQLTNKDVVINGGNRYIVIGFPDEHQGFTRVKLQWHAE